MTEHRADLRPRPHLTARLASLVALLCLWAAPAAAQLESAEDVTLCMNGNVPQETFSQMLGITTYDGASIERRMVIQMYGRRIGERAINLMLHVLRPEELAGTRYLLRSGVEHDDVRIYLPSLRATREIDGEMVWSNLWGTDFSYVDLKQIFGVFSQAHVAREDDGMLGDRPVYRLAVRPAQRNASPYGRIISHVDQRTCLALRIDFFAPDGHQLKQLQLNPEILSKEDGRFVGHEWTMQDLRTPNRRTELHLGDVRYHADLNDAAFDPRLFMTVE